MTGSVLASDNGSKCARKVMLVILDGWGLGAPDETNAIFAAETKYWDDLISRYPYAVLNASGASVGLADGKAGNSEAGHLNLGAGRIVPQDDRRLDDAIADGTYAHNPVFVKAVEDTRKRGSSLHIISYLSKKSSHGSIDYALEICKMAKELPEIYLHIIFDGRSTVPGSAPEMLLELDRELSKIGAGVIVDGVGRGLVLERNYDYNKVKQGYDAMVIGRGKKYS
jgi:2,3-bisphosphoglycerate-independent phosphoglycerate mutase